MAKSPHANHTLAHRQAALIACNTRWLRQAHQLVSRLDDRTYATPPANFLNHRVSAHLRHILEFYQCFLDGVDNFHIDYDARRRDHALEHSRTAARNLIDALILRLETCPELRGDSTIWVKMEDADAAGVNHSFLESSVARELQALSSHTIHHFALIAVTLTLHGAQVDPDFGMAPSTLRYLASRPRVAEAA